MKPVPPHFYRQSAILPYRLDSGRIEVMLVTSRRKRRWVLPKGVVEPNLTPRQSAVAEAGEEAGIEGEVSPEPVGSYEYHKWQGTCRVEVFVMRVTRVHETWPESWRERCWLSPDEAAARVEETALSQMILRLAAECAELVD